jgi:hypothetical protein
MLSKIAKKALRVTFSDISKTAGPSSRAVFELNKETDNSSVQEIKYNDSELQ